MSISKFNKGGVIFDVDISGYEMKTREELYKTGETYVLKGLYVNKKKGKGKEYPVAILDGIVVALGGHLVDTVEEILQDAETINDIKEGRAGIKFTKYKLDDGGHFGSTFVDLKD